MILDGENLFYNAATLTSGAMTSDVLKVGVGETGGPPILVLRAAHTCRPRVEGCRGGHL